MKLVVLIKQIPNTSNVQIDPKTGNLVREGVTSIMNPEDRHALEEALSIKDHSNAVIDVISMGPPQAIEVICEGLSMGADRGILLTDRAFAGADTWATSTALGNAIRKNGPFDLIFAGRQAIDGDTAQIGPQIAEFLGIPQITFVSALELYEGKVIANRTIENGCEKVETPLPALITCLASLNEPRYPTVGRILDSVRESTPIEIWNAADIGVKAQDVGLAGSLTQVLKTFTPKGGRETQYLEGTPSDIASGIVQFLTDRQVRLGE